jgi:hypothetical protein
MLNPKCAIYNFIARTAVGRITGIYNVVANIIARRAMSSFAGTFDAVRGGRNGGGRGTPPLAFGNLG